MTVWNGHSIHLKILLHLTEVKKYINMKVVSVELNSGF